MDWTVLELRDCDWVLCYTRSGGQWSYQPGVLRVSDHGQVCVPDCCLVVVIPRGQDGPPPDCLHVIVEPHMPLIWRHYRNPFRFEDRHSRHWRLIAERLDRAEWSDGWGRQRRTRPEPVEDHADAAESIGKPRPERTVKAAAKALPRQKRSGTGPRHPRAARMQFEW